MSGVPTAHFGLGHERTRERGTMGLEQTLRVLAEYPDRETTVPVMGQALREERARGFACRFLLAASETRAPRELVDRKSVV